MPTSGREPKRGSKRALLGEGWLFRASVGTALVWEGGCYGALALACANFPFHFFFRGQLPLQGKP